MSATAGFLREATSVALLPFFLASGVVLLGRQLVLRFSLFSSASAELAEIAPCFVARAATLRARHARLDTCQICSASSVASKQHGMRDLDKHAE